MAGNRITSRIERGVSEQHGQTVDTNAFARGGRHAVFQRHHIVFIVEHGFVVAGVFFRHLGAKTLGLVFSVIQLGKAVGNFAAADKELEALGDKRIAVFTAGPAVTLLSDIR